MASDAERTSATTVERGLGMLERAWDAQWALRLICFVLFIDMAMMLHTKRGLWQWTAGDMKLLSNVGWIALSIVAFSFLAAIVVPVVVALMRYCAMWLPLLIPMWIQELFSTDEQLYQRPLGYVFATDLRDLALQEKDKFLYDLYEKHEDARRSDRASLERSGQLTVAALLAALANFYVVAWAPGSVGLIGASLQAFGNWAPLVAGLVTLCALVLLKWAWFPKWSPNLIYYPPLDKVLREQERARKEEMEKFQRRDR